MVGGGRNRSRAATWEARFPNDDPAYAAAVAEVGLGAGRATLAARQGRGPATTT